MIQAIDLRNVTMQKAGLTILKTLAYFDIFDYPLYEEEIKNFLGCSVNDPVFTLVIQRLVSDEIIFKLGELYSLQNDWQKTAKRLQGNYRAQKLFPKAIRIGTFLYKFPYVRAVGISGSLSKNYADEKADFDFFIITKANRLWIARTILHLFKKFTFLVGKQNLYCMNYFVDEEALKIKEKNIYTATEIVTLFPVAGYATISEFLRTNKWVAEWLPVYAPDQRLKISEKGSLLKKLTEWIFDNKTGNRIDDLFFKWTTRRWKKKEKMGRKNSKGRVMNLVTNKHFSKSNPEAFQEKIVELYKTKVEELESRWLKM
jgi:hypothetical protein